MLQSSSLNTKELIEIANDLAHSGAIDDALDIIYDTIDDLALSGKFEDINAAISELEPQNLEEHVIIGLLSITLPFKKHIPSRQWFYEESVETITDTNQLRDLK